MERCCSWKRCVQTRTWKEVVWSNTWNGVHGRISMTKPLDFYLKYLVLSNPPLDLYQT
jgi:hypothetical protein